VLIFALALAAFQKTEIENWWPIIKAAGMALEDALGARPKTQIDSRMAMASSRRSRSTFGRHGGFAATCCRISSGRVRERAHTGALRAVVLYFNGPMRLFYEVVHVGADILFPAGRHFSVSKMSAARGFMIMR